MPSYSAKYTFTESIVLASVSQSKMTGMAVVNPPAVMSVALPASKLPQASSLPALSTKLSARKVAADVSSDDYTDAR